VFGGKMKTLRIMIVLVIICSLCLVACGGKKKKSGPTAPDKPWEPAWWGLQDSSEFVYTYGFAEKSSERTAYASAEAMARAEAAVYVENHVQTMTKDFISEVGTLNPELTQLVEVVTRFTANATFSGAMITERDCRPWPGMGYKAWVRVSIPKDTINREFMNRVRNEEALYNRFRASQAFEELDRAVNR
jgi:hypothetical protein